MTPESRERVEAATVIVEQEPGRFGQGVLVAGGVILTAAHCVDWDTGGRMELGDCTLVYVKPPSGESFVAEVAFVDPVSGAAALIEPGSEVLCEESDKFDAFCGSTQPVPIFLGRISVPDMSRIIAGEAWPSMKVAIWRHTRSWVDGIAEFIRGAPRGVACLKVQGQVPSGTSGGPIVNEAGELLGVVSSDHNFPFLPSALPGWLWKKITDTRE